ncbi:hypothetical protein BH09PAT3_BH09PAT3_4560 [soil metagenome]
MKTTYTTTILGFGNHAAIEIPEANLAELGANRRAPVIVHLGDYQYQSTSATMDGKLLIPFAQIHRDASGVQIGDTVSVTLELDAGYREVVIPPELKLALKESNLSDVFTKQSYSNRKEFVRQINDAKTPETKERRIAKVITSLQKK